MPRTAVFATLLFCIGMLSSVPKAAAGDFAWTFNSRLTCEYSSWHEGKVVGVFWRYVKIELSSDLLRHAPKKTVWMKNVQHNLDGLKKGDIVLINLWTKPKKIDHTKYPNSFTFTPHFMGKVDATNNRVTNCPDGSNGTPIINWFYRTRRWDARVGYDGGIVYAKLPTGRTYLIYDERNRQRPSEFPASLAPKKACP